MPRLTIDPDSPVPILRQIVSALRVEMVEGRLTPGTPMPSARRLAIDLGVHFNTVAEAYRQLAAEGWLDLRHGRAAVVAARAAPPAASRTEMSVYRRRLRELISEMRANGVTRARIAAELRAQKAALES